MSSITVPLDHRMEVKMLPAAQYPFDKDCNLPRELQAMMFHYDVPKGVVTHFADGVGHNLMSFRLADPDSEGGKEIFNAVVKGIKSPAHVYKLRLVVRRLCRENPYAALSDKRPADGSDSAGSSKASRSSSDAHASGSSSKDSSGSRKDTSSGGSKSSSGNSSKSSSGNASKSSLSGNSSKSAASSSGNSSKPSSSSTEPSKSSAHIEYEEVSGSDFADSDVNDDSDVESDEKDEKKFKASGEVKCLNQLFHRVANDVSCICPCLFFALF